ncbi:hypothetical protein CAEBREN_25371 [Caenorhabditis brenneri]|uniref:Uncharacterized protein n=1 Tax=Caenorhabditis brenneri TaxID=135651 RepID=G0P4F5_CAEBE|nr:hypothetical protein CAEBREN_25371 [Caenorhabditis brenneri]
MDDWEAFGEDYDPDREWNRTPGEQAERRSGGSPEVQDTEELMEVAMENVETDTDRAWNRLFVYIEKPKLNTRMKDNSYKKNSGVVRPNSRIPERPNRLSFPPRHVPQYQRLPVAVPTWSPSYGNQSLQGVQRQQFAAPSMPNMIPTPPQQPLYPYSPYPYWPPMVPHWTGRYMMPSIYFEPRPFPQHHFPYVQSQRIPPMFYTPQVAQNTSKPGTQQDLTPQQKLLGAGAEKRASEEPKKLIPKEKSDEEEIKVLEKTTMEKAKELRDYRSLHEQLCAEAREFNEGNQELKEAISKRQENLKFYLVHQGPIIPSVAESIMNQKKIQKFHVAKGVYEKWRKKNYKTLEIETKYGADISIFLFNARGRIGVPQKVRKATGGHNLHRCLNPKEGINWKKKGPKYRQQWEDAHEKIKKWQMQLKELDLIELYDSEAYRAINVRKRNFKEPRP